MSVHVRTRLQQKKCYTQAPAPTFSKHLLHPSAQKSPQTKGLKTGPILFSYLLTNIIIWAYKNVAQF